MPMMHKSHPINWIMAPKSITAPDARAPTIASNDPTSNRAKPQNNVSNPSCEKNEKDIGVVAIRMPLIRHLRSKYINFVWIHLLFLLKLS